MVEKTKTWWLGFAKGFTIFHALGTVCVLMGFFIGDTPDIIVKRSEKLVLQSREVARACTVVDKATHRKICFMPVEEIKSLAAVAYSLGEDAKKIIGSKGEINTLGLRVPFQLTGAQILGIMIFFFGTINSVLKSRFGKGEK